MGVSEILSLWPDVRALADDIGRPYDTVFAWKRRGSVPVEYWPAIVASARTRNLPVTEGMLLAAAKGRQRSERVTAS